MITKSANIFTFVFSFRFDNSGHLRCNYFTKKKQKTKNNININVYPLFLSVNYCDELAYSIRFDMFGQLIFTVLRVITRKFYSFLATKISSILATTVNVPEFDVDKFTSINHFAPN